MFIGKQQDDSYTTPESHAQNQSSGYDVSENKMIGSIRVVTHTNT